jgi:GntR family transcriptional regulator, transcriptional repressor for pyruvate dehydrogenase complex
MLMSVVSSGSESLDRCIVALEQLVVDELEPGQQLPSEAELSVLTGLSRVTVRESLKVLSGRGLVELRKGTRAIVRQPDSRVLSEFLSVAIRRDPRGLLDLVEVRQGLEVQAAGAAARRATRASLAAIEAALQDMEQAAVRPGGTAVEDYHAADVAFHEALALASGNRMLAFVLEGLAEALQYSFRRSAEGHLARGGSFEEAIESHRVIHKYVAAGDVAGAEQAMRAHLHVAALDLRAALQSAPPE